MKVSYQKIMRLTLVCIGLFNTAYASDALTQTPRGYIISENIRVLTQHSPCVTAALHGPEPMLEDVLGGQSNAFQYYLLILDHIADFFEASPENPKNVLLIPYGVTPDTPTSFLNLPLGSWMPEWEDLQTSLQRRFQDRGMVFHALKGENHPNWSAQDYVKDMQGIFVCGDNVLLLEHMLRTTGLYSVIQGVVASGQCPYYGAAAGSVMACIDLKEEMRAPSHPTYVTSFKGLGFLRLIGTSNYELSASFFQIMSNFSGKAKTPLGTFEYADPARDILMRYPPYYAFFTTFARQYVQRQGASIRMSP